MNLQQRNQTRGWQAYLRNSYCSRAEETNPNCVDLQMPSFFVIISLLFLVNNIKKNKREKVEESINIDPFGCTRILIKINKKAIMREEKA